MVGHQASLCIAYILPWRCGTGLRVQERAKVNVAANYLLVHWPPPHIAGIEFAKLDSYHISGRSATIFGTIPYHRIHPMIGAACHGPRRVCGYPSPPLSFIKYIFIKSD